MIQCPECRNMIPDDSAFCDQCGKELKWCPECKRPKRGTECPVCGSDLIPGRKWLEGGAASAAVAGEGTASDPVRGSAAHPSPPGGWAPPSNGAEGGTPLGGSPSPATSGDAPSNSTPSASALVGNGWRLTLQPGQFGRAGGIWPELGTCPYVSSRHGTISGDAGNWNITDIGSTNGTFVDGVRLQTGVATPLKKGARVRIATLDFTVE